MANSLTFQINEKMYLKDPASSELGKSIIRNGVDLMAELGLEDFTFKKLAIKVGTTEATLYRYFLNKHNFLAYVTTWYWLWKEYQLELAVANVQQPEVALKSGMAVFTQKVEEDSRFDWINEENLHTIIIRESVKLLFNKKVDQDNSQGFFTPYKRIVQKLSDYVLQVNPDFAYPHMLISTLIEGANHQHFFADHLPKLTDPSKNCSAVKDFCDLLIDALLQNSSQNNVNHG